MTLQSNSDARKIDLIRWGPGLIKLQQAAALKQQQMQTKRKDESALLLFVAQTLVLILVHLWLAPP